jgi:hypothetical protein
MASDDVTKTAQNGCASGGCGCNQPQKHATPLLDDLETGPWPSFVTGLKRLRDSEGKHYAPMMNDLLGQLEHSYEERLGFWKGGTVSASPRSPRSFLSRKNSTHCAFNRRRATTTRPTFCGRFATPGRSTAPA